MTEATEARRVPAIDEWLTLLVGVCVVHRSRGRYHTDSRGSYASVISVSSVASGFDFDFLRVSVPLW